MNRGGGRVGSADEAGGFTPDELCRGGLNNVRNASSGSRKILRGFWDRFKKQQPLLCAFGAGKGDRNNDNISEPVERRSRHAWQGRARGGRRCTGYLRSRLCDLMRGGLAPGCGKKVASRRTSSAGAGS